MDVAFNIVQTVFEQEKKHEQLKQQKEICLGKKKEIADRLKEEEEKVKQLEEENDLLERNISELETECQFKLKSKQEWIQNVQLLEDGLSSNEIQIAKINKDTIEIKRNFLESVGSKINEKRKSFQLRDTSEIGDPDSEINTLSIKISENTNRLPVDHRLHAYANFVESVLETPVP